MIDTRSQAHLVAQPSHPNVDWSRHEIAIEQGVRLAVFRCGRTEPGAPTLVLLHGLGHWSQAAWDRMAAELSDDFRLIAVDLPGFGESDKPDVRYDLRFFTETMAALIERLDVDRFGLVGHSLGGLIAASYAAQRPERIALLALIDPAGFRRTARLLLGVAGSAPAAWVFRMRPSRRFVRHTLNRSVVDPAVIPETMHERAFRFAQDPAYLRAFTRVYGAALADLRDLQGLHARLGTYPGPVLLFWGRRDRYVPIRALASARRVYPRADVTILERSAHMPNLEEPGAIAARIRAAFRAP